MEDTSQPGIQEILQQAQITVLLWQLNRTRVGRGLDIQIGQFDGKLIQHYVSKTSGATACGTWTIKEGNIMDVNDVCSEDANQTEVTEDHIIAALNFLYYIIRGQFNSRP